MVDVSDDAEAAQQRRVRARGHRRDNGLWGHSGPFMTVSNSRARMARLAFSRRRRTIRPGWISHLVSHARGVSLEHRVAAPVTEPRGRRRPPPPPPDCWSLLGPLLSSASMYGYATPEFGFASRRSLEWSRPNTEVAEPVTAGQVLCTSPSDHPVDN